MARRNGRKGDWLAQDQYYGTTQYASRLKLDYWGSRAVKPLKRNLQEIATPLLDPEPVPFFTGSDYEQYLNGGDCIGNYAPQFVGNTRIPTNPNNAAYQVLQLNPAIPDMEIGCTFVVSPDPWTVASAAYSGTSYLSAETNDPIDLLFSDDGLTMYMTDGFTFVTYQYTLTTPFQISTATYSGKSFNPTAQAPSGNDIFFGNSGTKLFVVDYGSSTVFQWTLSTAWDVSTASYDSVSVYVGATANKPFLLFFRNNGLQMYVMNASNKVFQFTLTTAWDVSTATYANIFFNSSAQVTDLANMFINPDGFRLFIIDYSGFVYQYTLQAPWNIGSAVYDNVSFNSSAQNTFADGLWFGEGGSIMLIADALDGHVYQYTT